jgi:RRXRR protein
MLAVFVLDRRKKPLMPCSEKRARLLLTRGRAVVHRRYPFTIRLKDLISFNAPTGTASSCRLRRFGTASRPLSSPRLKAGVSSGDCDEDRS